MCGVVSSIACAALAALFGAIWKWVHSVIVVASNAVVLISPETENPRMSWSKEACLIQAVIGNDVLEHRVSVQFNESALLPGYGVACLRQERKWITGPDACLPVQRSQLFHETPFRCFFVPGEGASLSTSASMPVVTWKSSSPDSILMESVCWPGGGTCVSRAQATLNPSPFLPAGAEGVWFRQAAQEEDHGSHIEILSQQADGVACAVFFVAGQQSENDVFQCGGCAASASLNGSSSSSSFIMRPFCVGSGATADLQVELEKPAGGVQRANIIKPSSSSSLQAATSLRLTQVSTKIAGEIGDRLWTCSRPFPASNGGFRWEIRRMDNMTTTGALGLFEVKPHSQEFAVSFCRKPLPTWARARRKGKFNITTQYGNTSLISCGDAVRGVDLFEESETLRVWKRPKNYTSGTWGEELKWILEEIAPGLWQGPGDSFFLLNPVGDFLLWILEDSAPLLCVPHVQRRSMFRFERGASVPPEERPLTCPSGKSAKSFVSVRNEEGPFFYRVATCEKAVNEIGSSHSCRCPWRWADANQSVLVDGAALLHSCAVWSPEKRALHSWRTNDVVPATATASSPTTTSRFLSGRDAARVSCPNHSDAAGKGILIINACSKSGSKPSERRDDDDDQCRVCLAGYTPANQRCFLGVESRSAAVRDPSSLRIDRGGLVKSRAPTKKTTDLCEPLLKNDAEEDAQDHGDGTVSGAASGNNYAWSIADGMMGPNFPFGVFGGPASENPNAVSPVQQMLALNSKSATQRILQNIHLPGNGKSAAAISVDLVIFPTSQGSNQIALVSSDDGRIICSTYDESGARVYPVHYASWSETTEKPWSWITIITPKTYSYDIINYKILHDNGKYGFHRGSAMAAWLWPIRLEVPNGAHTPRVQPSDTMLVQPHAGPRGGSHDLEASLVIDPIRATWAPFEDDPDSGRVAALAFASNFYYMTSHIQNMQAPPYVFDPLEYRRGLFQLFGTLEASDPVCDMDWRILYTLRPVASLWRQTGRLAVAFKLENKLPPSMKPQAWREMENWLQELANKGDPSCPYVIIEFAREHEVEVTWKRFKREDALWNRLRGLSQDSHPATRLLWDTVITGLMEPPSRNERQSRYWMRAVRWRFMLGIPGASSQLQDVPERGLLFWQIPDITLHRSYNRIHFPGAAFFPEADGVHIISEPYTGSSTQEQKDKRAFRTTTKGFWISDSLLGQSQEYSGFIETTLQPNILEPEYKRDPLSPRPPYTQLATNIVVMRDATGLKEGEVRLALLTYPVVFRDKERDHRRPLLNFITLRTEGPRSGFSSPTPLVELPLQESRSRIIPSRGLLRWQPWQPADASFQAWRDSAFPARIQRSSEHARTPWQPLSGGLLEFQLTGDRILEGPQGGGVLFVRVRRPVLRLRSEAAEDAQHYGPAQAHDAFTASLRNTAHAAHDLEPNACFLYRQATATGRATCRACRSILPRWLRFDGVPERVRVPDFMDAMETDDNDVVRNDAVVQYEELGSIALALRFPADL